MPYLNPKTGQEVALTGSLGEQNLAANKAGYDYVPRAVTPPATTPTPPTPANMSVGATNQAKGLNPNGTPTTPEAPTPTITTPTPTTTPSPYYSRVSPEPTPVTAQSATDLEAEKRRQAQAQIDALNKQYDSMLAQQATANEQARRSTSSISVLTGLAGSSEAGVQAEATQGRATKANQAIEAERGVAIQGVLSKIRSEAIDEAKQSRLEARQSAQDQVAYREKAQAEAVSNLTNLAAGGVTFDGLKTGDPEAFAHMSKMFGGDEALRGAFVLNTPQNAVIDKKIEGGKYIIAKQNPLTGKISIESVDLGIPPGYSKSVDLGNQMMFVPDNFDPNNPSGPQPYYVAKGIAPKAPKETGAGAQGAYASDLDAIIGRVPLIIPSENGKVAFNNAISKARDDGDKISAVATAVLRNSPAPVRDDFSNQAKAVKSIDKAIALINSGTQSGLLQNAGQYTFNVFGKDFDPKLAAINAYITSAIQPYRNSITGAAWGDQEDAEYKSLFGSTKYSPTELKERLVRIKEIMKDNSATALNMQINPVDTGYNPFTPKKSIDDYRQEFPQASDEELTALMNEETQ